MKDFTPFIVQPHDHSRAAFRALAATGHRLCLTPIGEDKGLMGAMRVPQAGPDQVKIEDSDVVIVSGSVSHSTHALNLSAFIQGRNS